MILLRYRLRPLSPWLTPWQADTLAGLLCVVMARAAGRERMYEEIAGPALAGEPPFVLSDAFPEALLPLPASVRRLPWPADRRAEVKRARFVTRAVFQRMQRGHPPALSHLWLRSETVVHDRWRNTLDRLSNSAGTEGGNLFAATETSLHDRDGHLSVYARVAPAWADRLTQLLRELSLTGFGADASVGRGQFALDGEPEDAGWLAPADFTPSPADDTACVCLSTFQPGPADPVDGAWEAFVKHGRLAPDFGLDDRESCKRPLLLLRPGATFAAGARQRQLGRAIGMDELLPEPIARRLAAQGTQVAHLAFGLQVPCALPRLPPPVSHE